MSGLTDSNDANDEIREMYFQKLMKFSNVIFFIPLQNDMGRFHSYVIFEGKRNAIYVPNTKSGLLRNRTKYLG